ncbi:MAG: hypothetical protein ACOZNI_01220 [Myxococcota bacterium]
MWLLLATLAAAEVVDRVRYVVGSRIITQSDVEFEAALDPFDESPVPALDDPAYPVEQRLVDFAVVRELAGDVSVYEPTSAEVRARFERVKATWPRPEDHAAFLARWGVDDEHLMGLLYSRLVVERYVLRNLGAATGVPLDREGWIAAYAPWIAQQRARTTVREVR